MYSCIGLLSHSILFRELTRAVVCIISSFLFVAVKYVIA